MAAVGPNPASVAVGDVNGDGLEDIVLANKDANTIGVFHKIPDEKALVRTFPDLPAGNGPGSVTLGDVDGDELKMWW